MKKDVKKVRFFDGPPFANGDPHYGHLVCSVLKDIYGRFNNIDVSNWVWDCHGLPIEMAVEKKYSINSKTNKEDFIKKCKEEVIETQKTWDYYINQVGRRVDFKKSIKTMDKEYEDKVVEIFNKLYDKGLIYESYKIMPYSYKCKTCLSKLEISMDNSYQNIPCNSAFVRVDVEGEEIEVWTTTIWTLPFNQAIAVNPKGKYKHLIGKTYKQLIEGYNETQTEYKIIGADWVDETTGSGAVHIATSFGENDFELGKQYDLKPLDVLDDECRFKDGFLKGLLCVSDEAEKRVLEALKKSGRSVRIEKIKHQYPMCPRTETKLVYRPIKCWFLNIQCLKNKMLDAIKDVNFYPSTLRKDFENVIKTAPDWCISRNRTFGVPLPTDESLVLDCWFESACVPYVVGCDLPSEFVCEYQAQIKGWFYNLLVISVALNNKAPYKNVIGHGTVLGSDGKKMSKHLHNFPDPKPMIQNTDAFRLAVASSNVSLGEDIKISNDFTKKAYQVLNQLENCKKFFETYYNLDKDLLNLSNLRESGVKLDFLDEYIYDLFVRVEDKIKESLECFNTKQACESLYYFINELSNFYIRNKRELAWEKVTYESRAKKVAFYSVMNTILFGLQNTFILTNYSFVKREELVDFQLFFKGIKAYNDTIYEKDYSLVLEDVVDRVKQVCNQIHDLRKNRSIPVKKPINTLYLRCLADIDDSFLENCVDIIKKECNILNVRKSNFFHKNMSYKIKKKDMILYYKRELIHWINTERKNKKCKLTEFIDIEIPNTLENREALKCYEQEIMKVCFLKSIILK